MFSNPALVGIASPCNNANPAVRRPTQNRWARGHVLVRSTTSNHMSANVVYVDTVRLLRKLVTGHKLTSSHLFLGAPVPRVLEEILERLLEGGPWSTRLCIVQYAKNTTFSPPGMNENHQAPSWTSVYRLDFTRRTTQCTTPHRILRSTQKKMNPQICTVLQHLRMPSWSLSTSKLSQMLAQSLAVPSVKAADVRGQTRCTTNSNKPRPQSTFN